MAVSGAVLVSEWTKVKTVRSTLVTLLAAFAVTVALGAVICLVTNSQWSTFTEQDKLTFDATSTSFSGVFLGQLAVIVFAVLVVGNEYSSGMIRVTLSAVPQRSSLLLAKTAAVLGLVLPVSLLTSFTAFYLGQALLGDHGVSLGDSGVLRAVLGMALYMTFIALFSLGVGFMLRKPVLSLGLLMPFFFLISPILIHVPGAKDVARYFPDSAGSRMAQVADHSSTVPYGPLTAFFICLAWALAALAGGYLLFRERDA